MKGFMRGALRRRIESGELTVAEAQREFCIPPQRKRRPSEKRRWLRRPVAWFCQWCLASGPVGPTSAVRTRCPKCRSERYLIFILPPHA